MRDDASGHYQGRSATPGADGLALPTRQISNESRVRFPLTRESPRISSGRVRRSSGAVSSLRASPPSRHIAMPRASMSTANARSRSGTARWSESASTLPPIGPVRREAERVSLPHIGDCF